MHKKWLTKKKSKKIKMKKKEKNSSFVVITSRGNTVAWSVNFSVSLLWASLPLACFTKRCHLSSTMPSTAANQKLLPGEHFSESGQAI